jgi:ATP-dependent DNA helicase RecQ
VLVRGFDRPQIHLDVQRHHDGERKTRALLDWVVEHGPGPGIVYAVTQRDTEELAAALVDRGIRAGAYHGGLPHREREEVQERFMEDGEIDVMVATIAFGMGVDKPDVRFVVHHGVSESIDAYYQEIGRAARDGKPARAVLFYRTEDLGTRRFQASGRVDREVLDRMARGLRAVPDRDIDPKDIAEDLGLSKTRAATALHRLEDVDIAVVGDDGSVHASPGIAGMDDAALELAVDEAERAEEEREAFERSRVEMVRSYAEHEGCRRAFILGYFGEGYDPPCGNCDNCDRGLSEPASARRSMFRVGQRVAHGRWGGGTVAEVRDGQVTVVFDSVGYKTLDEALVREHRLLTALA